MDEPFPSTNDKKSPVKDEIGLLDVLSLLIETGKVKTTSDLLRYTTQYGAPEAQERLRVLEAENIPMDLAFDAVSVHLRIREHQRNSSLLGECKGKKVGMVLPLPPHLPDLFLPIADVTYLQPGESGTHGMHVEGAIKGARACRAKAQEMHALVFEAFREGAKLFVDVAIADVLEPKMLPPDIRLIAHLRPHSNPKDVEIQTPTEVSFI
ncbi:MAG TPA: hypothetical protein VI306_24630 [Pyrinomonadaceae bacterium]